MGLDVALVHRLGGEFHLDDLVGLGKALFHVADPELGVLGNVGRRIRGRLEAAGDHVLVQQRRARLHGLDHVDDVGQHLVVDLDELERPGRHTGAGGGHGGHGVALV